MIAELVRQYDTLKKCNISVPDPYFDELAVWVEIILKSDGSFRVNWLGKPKDTQKNKKNAKEEPCKDMNCPVTEKSACRASGNDSPHGIVDNASWIFGRLLFDPKTGLEKAEQLQERQQSYLKQLKEFCDSSPTMSELKIVFDTIVDEQKRNLIWAEVETLLRTHIDEAKWKKDAGKAKIRWVIEKAGQAGKPVNALENVKNGWKAFQEDKNEWWITSLIDGQRKPARILHPKIKKGASLISFNNAATYCGHLSPEYKGKPGKKKEEAGGGKEKKRQKSRQNANQSLQKEETDGSSLPAQVGFEEAEKYTKALDWLIDNSSVRFGDSVICIWIDQGQSGGQQLDHGAYEFVKPQNEKSTFTRGKAKGGKGQVLADSGDLLKALQRFKNGQYAGYRDKRFYLLSLLLRRKGRHALLGGYVGTMGLLEDNANKFVSRTKVLIPSRYLNKEDEAREFCPTLMDILSAAGIKSEKKQRLVWDREVVEVIVAGRPLPADLCRLVIQKAIKDKHLEPSKNKGSEYMALLAIAAGCARHYLTANQGKEGYGMGLDINITDAGYLAGRLFALCENIQKHGRNWGPTLSDKLFSAAIDRPRQTLVQLYKNCLCYDIYKADSDCFVEIFEKVKLNDSDSGQGEVLPGNSVDEFAFMLGYWHQRSELRSKVKP
ncbi:MAG: type I-C CRISPR-associated protein Cas8c/Csd1 [Desulfosalsimonadaceae bacterium]